MVNYETMAIAGAKTEATLEGTNIQVSPVDMQARQKLDIKPGDTVRVSSKIQEKGKTRLQAFEGLVIAVKHGKEAGGTFTVRKITSGVGVEKIFALYSPLIDKIEITRRAKTRRAKLYYVRDKTSREIRRKIKRTGDEPLSTVDFAEPEPEEDSEEGEAAEAESQEEVNNENETAPEAAEENSDDEGEKENSEGGVNETEEKETSEKSEAAEEDTK